jgi:glycosyltransferase involved in cell wall biosynthesis
LRILVVGNYYPEHGGGIEFVCSELCRQYESLGHQVRWAAADVRAAPHRGDSRAVPLSAWNLTEDHFGFPYPILAPSALPALRRAVAWCDVVHVHDSLYLSSVLAVRSARRIGRPVLLTQHVIDVPYRSAHLRWVQQRAYSTLGRWVISRADKVVTVSPSVALRVQALAGLREIPQTIENGLDTSRFSLEGSPTRAELRSRLGVAEGTPVMLFVGRYVAKKGLHLVRSMAAARPDWRWVLIGRDGDVDPRGWIETNVTVLGSVPQRSLPGYFRMADALVLPSVGEGFPLVVQEAMACGIPAVVLSGTAEVRGGDEGLIHRSRADIDELIRATEEALAASSEVTHRARLSQFARDRWGGDRMVRAYDRLLVGLASSRRPAAARVPSHQDRA